jgi:SAM-dependent methyltransferase
VNRFHRRYCGSAHWRRHLDRTVLPRLALPTAGDVLEIGPGRGLVTRRLVADGAMVTAVEIDERLAERLRADLGERATVVTGDATALPFAGATFDTVVSATMLHHVPTAAAQDRLLAEAARVLRPGGTFVGSDSRASLVFRLAHLGDTMTLVDPETFAARLAAAGLRDPRVETHADFFAFRATR